MSNNVIPTAEDFVKSSNLLVNFDNSQSCILQEESYHLLVAFAKLHVEQALKEASEKGKCSNGTSVVIKDSILNSYSLDNIK